MTYWAAIARKSFQGGSTVEVPLPSSPKLIGASLLPPKHDPFYSQLFELEIQRHTTIAKRFDFHGSMIDQLMALVSSKSNVKNPTRVEVVTALLNRCIVNAAKKNNDPLRPFILFMPFTIQNLLNPLLPHKLVENYLTFFLVPIPDEGDLEIPTLVSNIQKEKINYFRKYKGININQTISTISNDTEDFKQNNLANTRLTTSLCGYQFYDMDFGFGKPEKVSIGAMLIKYSMVLFDSPCKGGIDVVITLEEEVMPNFEIDEELNTFTSLDPSY
ncbi:hypothetical protein LIER_11620 [Lithospermum erythrorhizon]|uniref:Uncharacterized protein n=1 Tax=Lithospermum erythrorhizon TaxID=34254 RepID=A0AAV3PRP3_LITER